MTRPKIARLERQEARFRLIPFADIRVSTAPHYRIKGLFPRTGLALVWGPPKCGKSFWAFDAVSHIALGWEYRGRRVQPGPVVYLAAEGEHGFPARVEAFRQYRMSEGASGEAVPFYLQPVRADLVKDHPELISAIASALPSKPAVVVIDTLNRTFSGSESSDEDMTAYVAAADAIISAFDCLVIVVHHCGVEGTRPRGHTSLTGAVDAQIAISRQGEAGKATVEFMKDGPEGDTLGFKLRSVEVAIDDEGEPITSCIVEPLDTAPVTAPEARLTANQRTMFGILHDAGKAGLTLEEWNEQTRAAGIGTSRKADLYDIRKALQGKRLAHDLGNGQWVAEL